MYEDDDIATLDHFDIVDTAPAQAVWRAWQVREDEVLAEAGGNLASLADQAVRAIDAAAEVSAYSRLSAQQRDFLLHLALLPKVSPQVAVTLSGRRDAVEVLNTLCRQGLGVERSAGREVRYILSPALRAALIDCMSSRYTEQRKQALLMQSVEALEQEGQIEEAFQVFSEQQDWEAAIGVLERHADQLIGNRSRQLVCALVQSLPMERRMANANCQYWLGRTLPVVDFAAKLQAYELAGRLYDLEGKNLAAIVCLSDVVLLRCAKGAAGPALNAALQRLRRLVAQAGKQMSDDHALLAYTALTRGIQFGVFPAGEARRWPARLSRLLANNELDKNKIEAATVLLHFYVHSGAFERAEELIARVDGLALHASIQPQKRIWWRIVCSEYYFVSGKIALGLDLLQRAESDRQAAGLAWIAPTILSLQLYCQLASSDLAAAEASIARFGHLLGEPAGVDHFYLSAGQAWYELLRNRPEAAAAHARQAQQLAEQLMMPFAEAYAKLALASTALACGDVAQAEHIFEKLRHDDLSCGNAFFGPQIEMVGMRIARAKGDVLAVKERLRSAFRQSRESQALTTIPWQPKVMADLCADALEYGVETDFVTTVIKTHSLTPRRHDAPSWPWALRIYVLGSFSIHKDGEELSFSGKAQRKPLEFLKALIALGGRDVDLGNLAHQLWPDAGDEAAECSFHSTLHRLRKLLGCEELIILSERKVSLNPDCCWVDAWAFEQVVGEQSFEGQADNALAPRSAWRDTVSRVLEFYRSDFLVLEEAQPWALPMRDRLRGKFLRFVSSVGDFLESRKQCDDAIELYQRALEIDCLAEDLYRRLMLCRRRRGELAAAFGVYRRCREMLSIITGTSPSEKTTALYRDMLAAH